MGRALGGVGGVHDALPDIADGVEGADAAHALVLAGVSVTDSIGD